MIPSKDAEEPNTPPPPHNPHTHLGPSLWFKSSHSDQFDGRLIEIFLTSSTVYFCGLVVTVPGRRSRGPGSIPGAKKFSEK
jgi:hypothetical protein